MPSLRPLALLAAVSIVTSACGSVADPSPSPTAAPSTPTAPATPADPIVPDERPRRPRRAVVDRSGVLRGLRAQFRRRGRRRHRRPARPDRAPRRPQRRRPVDHGRPRGHGPVADADRRVAELPRLRRHGLPGGRARLRHDRRPAGAGRGRRGTRDRDHRRPRAEPHLDRASVVRRCPRARIRPRRLVSLVGHATGGQRPGRAAGLARRRRPLLLRLLLVGDAGPERGRAGGGERDRRHRPVLARGHRGGRLPARRGAPSDRGRDDAGEHAGDVRVARRLPGADPRARSVGARPRRGLGCDVERVALRARRRARPDVRLRAGRRRCCRRCGPAMPGRCGSSRRR